MRIPATLAFLVLVAACGPQPQEEIIIVDPVPVVPSEPAFTGKL